MLIERILLGAYFGLLAGLSVFAVHRLFLVALRWRAGRTRPPRPPAPAQWPRVTVQLPLYNEPFVALRLLDAVARLQYPRDRLQVQVLDDSTDGSRAGVAARVAELRRQGLDIEHLCRARRTGYKAGALAAGLARARGEFVCVFDADFVPPPEFLQRLIPYFAAPDIGMVQARWGHLNEGASALARVQALFLDAHFAIEQAARCRSGRFFNFNGTAGIWRRAAIEQAGGWQHDTLTEDLDLSYRAQLAGWRFLYVDEPAAPAELPAAITAFRSQQARWTRGAVQTARKLLGRVWRADLPLAVKVEASFHMAANATYLMMVALSVLVVPAMVLRHLRGYHWMVWVDLPVLLFATGSVCLFLLSARTALGRSWAGALRWLLPAMALGIGIAPNNARAALAGLRGDTGTFVRTPKRGTAAGADAVDPAVRARLPLLELAFTLWFAAGIGIAAALGMWGFLPVLCLFEAGYGWVAAASLAERTRWSVLRSALRVAP